MFLKKGNKFPSGNDRENGNAKYAIMVGTSLRRELGDSHRAAKILMRWTGASERMAKYWLSGRYGPSGDHLLVLMRKSECVFETILTAAGRRDAFIATKMLTAYGTIVEMATMIERESASRIPTGADNAGRHSSKAVAAANDLKNDRIDDLVNRSPAERLNRRQRWYLQELSSGMNVRAADLQRRWRVSEKTARRDVAALKASGMVEFVGSYRIGRYRLID